MANPYTLPTNDRVCPTCGKLGSRRWTDERTGKVDDLCGGCMFELMFKEATNG